MTIKKLLGSSAVTIATLALGISPTSAASIINNGSFENGMDPGVFTTVHPGDTNITGWSVISGDVDYVGTYWQASDGHRSIDMTGDMAGAIRQATPTINGALYKVSFDLSGNPAGGPSLKTLNVDTGGTPTSFTYDTSAMGNTLANMKWMPESLTFNASSTSTDLTFTSLVPGFYGPALDDVSVEQIFPTSKDQCKNDGWRTFGVFKNQGDCVSYVATDGKNLPDGQ